MATPVPKTTISPRLQRIIARQEREATHLREVYGGDPADALMAFVREYFDEETLADVARQAREGRNVWNEDDEVDEP